MRRRTNAWFRIEGLFCWKMTWNSGCSACLDPWEDDMKSVHFQYTFWAMEILNSEALSTYMTPKKESINQMWHVFSISFQWQFLMFHFFRDVFVHQYEIHQLEWGSEVSFLELWHSSTKRKTKQRPDGSMSFSFSFEPGRCEAESVSAVRVWDWCFPERWWFNDACFREKTHWKTPVKMVFFLVGKRAHPFFRSFDLVCFYRDIIWFQRSWAL